MSVTRYRLTVTAPGSTKRTILHVYAATEAEARAVITDTLDARVIRAERLTV